MLMRMRNFCFFDDKSPGEGWGACVCVSGGVYKLDRYEQPCGNGVRQSFICFLHCGVPPPMGKKGLDERMQNSRFQSLSSPDPSNMSRRAEGRGAVGAFPRDLCIVGNHLFAMRRGKNKNWEGGKRGKKRINTLCSPAEGGETVTIRENLI